MPVSIVQTQHNAELIDIEQIIRNAKAAGYKQALNAIKCPTPGALLKKYGEQGADAYRNAYDECIADPITFNISQSNLLIRIKKLGARYARMGNHDGRRPLLESLKDKNKYTDAQANAYLEGFDSVKITAEERALQIAKKTASNSAFKGYQSATPEYLKEKLHYTDAQIAAYLEKHDRLSGTLEEQRLRRAKATGYRQAIDGRKCPARDTLLKKFSEQAADAYLQAFHDAVENSTVTITPERSALLIAKNAGRKYAIKNNLPPLPADLKIKNNYTDKQVEAYLQAFNKSRELAIQAAKTAYSKQLEKLANDRLASTQNVSQNSDNNVVPQMTPNCLLPGFGAFCSGLDKVVLLPSFKSLVERLDTINPRSIILRR